MTAERFPRPVVCAWCGNRYRSVLPAEIERDLQGDGCAASVYQITEEILTRARTAATSVRSSSLLDGIAILATFPMGTWVANGHYGCRYDCEIYRFIQNPPTAPADPVCDSCVSERLAAGDLERIEGNYP